MNRRLKFRVWEGRDFWLDNDKFWVQDGNAYFENGGEYDFSLCEIKNAVIQQYTGFKDKNGVEICDGDIIKYDVELNVVVCFGYRGAWMLSDKQNWVDTYLIDHLDKEIVGNIFQTPELLQ